jgi:lipopolysaccharide assembly outer membrane protein LptD (OstA)
MASRRPFPGRRSPGPGVVLLLFILSEAVVSNAQARIPIDSLFQRTGMDSSSAARSSVGTRHGLTILSPDSTAHRASRDSVAIPPSSIDTIVTYSAADSIVFSLHARRMDLFGKSQTSYQTMDLRAERVDLNWTDATLVAFGVRDTIPKDTVIGRPILKDAGDEYHGDRIRYNFRTRKGKITVGTTEMDKAYYKGEEIKKVDTDVLYVEDGRYTTCDLPDPHYYFASPKMKVYVRDQVIAEPVYFYIADVPIFALPFGVFPSKSGRASGLIAPAYGEDVNRGKYFSHLGYYWAINDYLDLASAFSYYARGGWENRSNLRYRLRYEFSGALDVRFASQHSGELGDPGYTTGRDYLLSWVHAEELSPSSRLDVNFSFMSSSYLRNYSSNLNDILTQDIFSNATYWKSWESANRSLTVNISREQNLASGNVSQSLPSVSFTQGRIFPFRSASRARGLTTSSESSQGFWDMLGLDYSASFQNYLLKQQTSVDSVLRSDSLQSVKDYSYTSNLNLAQSLVFSISPKIGRVTLSPSLSFSDTRQMSTLDQPLLRRTDSLLTRDTTHTRMSAGRVTAGISTSTRLYGVMQPHLFGVTAFRHTFSPTLGISYSKQVYGENIPKYSFIASYGASNTFEMKYQTSDTAKEEKLQLLNLGLSGYYNVAADSMKLSDLNVNFRTDIGRILSISGGANYNFYVFDPSANAGRGSRVNRYLLSDRGKFADMTNFSLSFSTSYQAQKKTKSSSDGTPDTVAAEQERASTTNGFGVQKKTYYSIYDREEANFSIPWSVTLGYTFAQSQPDPRVVTRTSSVNFTLSFNLTEKWQISTRGSYDFVNKQHYIPSVDITRDLHCWEMSFSWRPMGYYAGYRLEIRVKAPQMQDIKLTKQSSSTLNNY